jgi:hypothetical protein
MNKPNFDALSDDELVKAYVDEAAIWGKNVLNGEGRKTGKAVYRLGDMEKEFSVRGNSCRQLLLPFLKHRDQGVRYYVAREVFSIAPAEARAVIEELMNFHVGPISANAGFVLDRLVGGEHKPVRG